VLFLWGASVKFTKEPLTLSGQLSKLVGRGLQVADKSRAEHYLRFIGYYRLSAYALAFQQSHLPDKPFQAGTRFDDILDLYRFDRELRLLTMDAIERIEVAVRTCIVNEMCHRHGAHWFMTGEHFYPRYAHDTLLRKIEKELGIRERATAPRRPHNETFINHYYEKYGEPHLPPAWMVAETLSLGVWSQIFENLRSGDERKAVAANFGTDEAIFSNWLHVLTYIRNICAHHGRLWNRQFVIKLKVAKRHQHVLGSTNDRYYALAVVIEDLMRRVAPGTGWHLRLHHLLQTHAFVSPAVMRFPQQWQDHEFWSGSTTPLALPSNKRP